MTDYRTASREEFRAAVARIQRGWHPDLDRPATEPTGAAEQDTTAEPTAAAGEAVTGQTPQRPRGPKPDPGQGPRPGHQGPGSPGYFATAPREEVLAELRRYGINPRHFR